MTIDSMVKWSREWVAEFPRCGALIVCGVHLLVKKIRNNDCSAERRQSETLIRATRKSQIVFGIVLVLLLLNKLCCSSSAKYDSDVFTSSGRLLEAESKSFGEQEDFATKGRDWVRMDRPQIQKVIVKDGFARPVVGQVYNLMNRLAFVRFTGSRGVSIFRGADRCYGTFLNFAIISNRPYVDGDHPDTGFYLCLDPFEYETVQGGIARVHCFRPLTPAELKQFEKGQQRQGDVEQKRFCEEAAKDRAKEKERARKRFEQEQKESREFAQDQLSRIIEGARDPMRNVIVQASLKDKLVFMYDKEFCDKFLALKEEQKWFDLLVEIAKLDSGFESERKNPDPAGRFAWVGKKCFPSKEKVVNLISTLQNFRLRIKVETKDGQPFDGCCYRSGSSGNFWGGDSGTTRFGVKSFEVSPFFDQDSQVYVVDRWIYRIESFKMLKKGFDGRVKSIRADVMLSSVPESKKWEESERRLKVLHEEYAMEIRKWLLNN